MSSLAFLLESKPAQILYISSYLRESKSPMYKLQGCKRAESMLWDFHGQ